MTPRLYDEQQRTMSTEGNSADHAQTSMRATISIAPISDADERVVDLFASFAFDLARLVGCSRQTSSNVNIRTMDETSAALQNNLLSTGELRLELTLANAQMHVQCVVNPNADANSGTEAWFRLDELDSPDEDAAPNTLWREQLDYRRNTLGGLTAKSSTRKRFGMGSGHDPDDGGGSAKLPLGVIPLRKKPR